MLSKEIIVEAVQYADGWIVEHDKITRGYVQSPLSDPSRMMLAGLASQLISQVEVPGRIRVEANTGFTAIRNCEALKDGHTPMWVDIVAEYGPNRDENSIIACVEFLRGLK